MICVMSRGRALRPVSDGDSAEETDAGAMAGPRVGRVVKVVGREVWVEAEGAPPAPARIAAGIELADLRQAALLRQDVVLLFERGDRARPLLMALLQPTTRGPVPRLAEVELPAGRRGVRSISADVDGKRVAIKAQDEIVFECGKASVTLRRNGRVVIRGTHVETHSEGTNRIKGAQVRVN
jgi:hypothetical protein